MRTAVRLTTNVRTAVDRRMPSAPHRPPLPDAKRQNVLLPKATENKGQKERQFVSLPSGAGAGRRKPIDFAAIIARAVKPPAELSQIVDTIGPDATLKLLEAKGGTRVYVPKPSSAEGAHLAEGARLSEGAHLVDIVGAEMAERLRRALGGRAIRFPTVASSPQERTVDRLLRVLGEDAVRHLVTMHGGRNIHTPRGSEAGCQLVVLLGIEGARRVRDEFGTHVTIRVPPIITPRPVTAWERLIELVGEEGAHRLREAQSGRVFRVPPPDSSNALAKIIGAEAARRFSEAFGGEQFATPIARAWRCRMLRVRGWTIPAIASRLCVTERAVSRILSDAGLRNDVWRYIQSTLDAAAPEALPGPMEHAAERRGSTPSTAEVHPEEEPVL